MTLDDIFPDVERMTLDDALKELGWEAKENEEGTGVDTPTCCGQPVSLRGMLGAEVGWCEKCGKGLRDLTGLHFITSGACWSPVNEPGFEHDYENDDKVWCVGTREDGFYGTIEPTRKKEDKPKLIVPPGLND